MLTPKHRGNSTEGSELSVAPMVLTMRSTAGSSSLDQIFGIRVEGF